MSRPFLPPEARRTSRIQLLVTKRQKARLIEAAALVNGPGRPLTEYVREVVQRQVELDIRRYAPASSRGRTPNATG